MLKFRTNMFCGRRAFGQSSLLPRGEIKIGLLAQDIDKEERTEGQTEK